MEGKHLEAFEGLFNDESSVYGRGIREIVEEKKRELVEQIGGFIYDEITHTRCELMREANPHMSRQEIIDAVERDLARDGSVIQRAKHRLLEDIRHAKRFPHTRDRIEISYDRVEFHPYNGKGLMSKPLLPIERETLQFAFRLNDPTKHQLTARQLFFDTL